MEGDSWVIYTTACDWGRGCGPKEYHLYLTTFAIKLEKY